MGTEIFPLLISITKILVYILAGLAVIVCAIAGMQIFFVYRNDAAKREELKNIALNSLIALIIVSIVYVVLLGVGPAFQIIFGD